MTAPWKGGLFQRAARWKSSPSTGPGAGVRHGASLTTASVAGVKHGAALTPATVLGVWSKTAGTITPLV